MGSGVLLQEFKLIRVVLRINAVSALAFIPLFWKFIPPANHFAFLTILVLTVVYSAGLYFWLNDRNYRVIALILIFLLTVFNTVGLFVHPLSRHFIIALLIFTFILGINVLVVSWPDVLVTNILLYATVSVIVWLPQTGVRQSLAGYGIDATIAAIALSIYFALILLLGTGLVEVKRKTEGKLRELNKNLNQRVEEKVTEIQQTQEQLERILRHIPVGVVIVDERLNVIYTNGVHFQFSLQEGKAREHPKTLLPLELLREQFLKEKAPRLLENREDLVGHRLEFIRPDQHLLIIRYSFVCVRLASEKGELLRLVLVTENITGEETLRNKLVRTNQLAEMGKMAASLVHAVNNPLAGIKLNLELMEMGLLNSDKREKIFATLTKGVNRIDRIIRSFLSFARQERPRKQWTRIQTILRDTLDMTANYQPYHGIQVRLECDQDLPAIAVDRLRLEQVFVNLINNARDAMTRGGGELLIHCGQEDEHLVIRVQDSGKGIKPEDLPKIFTPFFTTKERGHGTGLGLATSYGIIQEHGGSLEAESREGAGATFTIRLPIISQETKKGGG